MEDWTNLPDLIEHPIKMQRPNEPIEIFRGVFTLKQGNLETSITGAISFEWFPEIGPKFSGEGMGDTNAVPRLNMSNDVEVKVNSFAIGKGHLTRVSTSDKVTIEGRFTGEVIQGEKSIAISKILFTVPNLRYFRGDSVKKVVGSKVQLNNSRITFDNGKYLIKLDKIHDFDNHLQDLTALGGFTILYNGTIEKKNGSIAYAEARDLLPSLYYFFGFLNGRRCSPVFLKGIHEGESVWTDYSGYQVDPIKVVHSWPCKMTIEGLNPLWCKWCELFKDESDRDFLTTAVHWYVEANSNAGLVEGSLVLVQTALELIYNWFIVETKGILVGPDALNISASNKIRILLNQLSVDYGVPTTLQNLTDYKNEMKEVIDGPECFVRIRNAIVHANEDKRKMLAKIPLMARYEALQLALWYVELALLKILGHDGKYSNRTKPVLYTSGNEEDLPWN